MFKISCLVLKFCDIISLFLREIKVMKKAKFITSIISLCLMLSVCTFAVYALSSYSFTSNRDLNFSATDEVFFEAEISYNYPNNYNPSFSFSRN